MECQNTRLRKGREFMRKIIAVISALLLVGCMAVVFYGCGADDENTTTMPETSDATITQSTTMMPDKNDGVVTDESEKGDNGVIGDIVTDVSEGISQVVTDVSEGVSGAVTDVSEGVSRMMP